MNSVQKVRYRRQNEPLPKAKFLRVNQHTKSEIQRKKYNKNTPRAFQQESGQKTVRDRQQRTKGR